MTSALIRHAGTAVIAAAVAVAVTTLWPGKGAGINTAASTDLHAEMRSYLLENPEVIMEAVAVLEERQADAKALEDVALVNANAEDLFSDPTSWVGGNPEGNVTVVEFLDYRCGYCKRAFPEVQMLLESDPDIRLIVKELPVLGEDSVLASRYAIATKIVEGDAAYKAFHDTLMGFDGAVNDTTLRRVSDGLGHQTDAIVAQLNSPEVSQIIADNHQLAQRLKIEGTPAFVMGDQMIRGYMRLDGMQQVAAELRSASGQDG